MIPLLISSLLAVPAEIINQVNATTAESSYAIARLIMSFVNWTLDMIGQESNPTFIYMAIRHISVRIRIPCRLCHKMDCGMDYRHDYSAFEIHYLCATCREAPVLKDMQYNTAADFF